MTNVYEQAQNHAALDMQNIKESNLSDSETILAIQKEVHEERQWSKDEAGAVSNQEKDEIMDSYMNEMEEGFDDNQNVLTALDIFESQGKEEESPVEETPLKVLDDQGRTDLVLMPDGTSWKFTYDGDQLIKARAVNTEVKLGGRSWQDLKFTYDESGNLTTMIAEGNQYSSPRTYLRTEDGFVNFDGKQAPFYLSQDGTSFGFYNSKFKGGNQGLPVILAGPESNI